ncbi:MAG: Tol-Pal system beta propeller repeat protein TolB [Gammaproteobacteria bacterium]|nr:Tol-Pal system beta propeller repeat protein TolB [Gammaproteobacteria bacterium]
MFHKTPGPLTAILLLCLAWAPAQAVLTVKITQGTEGALPIAVVPFQWQGATSVPPQRFHAIIGDDLRRSGRFRPVAESDLPARPHQGSEVDFGTWRKLGVDNLVVGRLQAQPGGRYRVEFQLFDVYKGTQLAGYSIPVAGEDLRLTAHRISDIIYQKLTGERGAFATYIAYVTEDQDPAGKRRYTLEVADSDGANPQTLLTSGQPIMSPAWSPDGSRLAYVSFESGNSAVYVQKVRTGEREQVAGFEGINSAPAWSPDGRFLALTLSRDGNPEIYTLALDGGTFRRITDHGAIDTEPNWSPDGRHIVFTSDRGGRAQIYRVAAGGGRPARITFEGDYNARPRHSPDGERLAMVHGLKGAYHVAIMDMATGSLRILSDSSLDETPSFAPNGSMVIYATNDASGAVLAAVSVDGRTRQRLSVQQGRVREPAWSPFIE